MSLSNRIADLLRLAEEEGIELPMPATAIAALEEDGHIVDLTTGETIIAGADDRFSLSAAGEALVHIWDDLTTL